MVRLSQFIPVRLVAQPTDVTPEQAWRDGFRWQHEHCNGQLLLVLSGDIVRAGCKRCGAAGFVEVCDPVPVPGLEQAPPV